ncbi:MAG: VTC domain-containing protein, partial [Bacteroidales bacterium]|nr:VTC domain-containing protein [Bacteroidales bacterium]
MVYNEKIDGILQSFSPISLEEMGKVKLMNRIDTKYLVTTEMLVDILSLIKDEYFVQSKNGTRISGYNTLYYDTPDLQMYLAHHNRKLNRQKLRARIYTDSNLAFCEIKNKNNKGRTKKKRVEMPVGEFGTMLENAAT